MRQQIENLRNFDFNQDEIEIEKFLPTLGINNECGDQLPKELSEYFGKGLKFWQYPNQFSKYIKFISGLEINSYLEIGCRWGGTFIITAEVLRRKNNDCCLYACDIIPPSEILSEYEAFSKFKYLQMSSSSDEFKNNLPEKLDLVLIDGDHSYHAVKNDYELVENKAKYIVFHDIYSHACPGVVTFWNEVKRNFKEVWEFIDQYESVEGNYLGIGLINTETGVNNL